MGLYPCRPTWRSATYEAPPHSSPVPTAKALPATDGFFTRTTISTPWNVPPLACSYVRAKRPSP